MALAEKVGTFFPRGAGRGQGCRRPSGRIGPVAARRAARGPGGERRAFALRKSSGRWTPPPTSGLPRRRRSRARQVPVSAEETYGGVSVEVQHRLQGPEDAPVVVFSNSLGTTSEMWDEQASVVAVPGPPVRGAAVTAAPSPLPAGPYSIADLAGDVIALLDRLGLERVSFCGLSIGGVTGMLARRPRPRSASTRSRSAAPVPSCPPPGQCVSTAPPHHLRRAGRRRGRRRHDRALVQARVHRPAHLPRSSSG